jgi:hypothetical protein
VVETSSVDSGQAQLEERLRQLDSSPAVLKSPAKPIASSPRIQVTEALAPLAASELRHLDPSQISLPRSPPPDTENGVSLNAGSARNEPSRVTKDSPPARLEGIVDNAPQVTLCTILSNEEPPSSTEPTLLRKTQHDEFTTQISPPADEHTPQPTILAPPLQPTDAHKHAPLIVPQPEVVRHGYSASW